MGDVGEGGVEAAVWQLSNAPWASTRLADGALAVQPVRAQAGRAPIETEQAAHGVLDFLDRWRRILLRESATIFSIASRATSGWRRRIASYTLRCCGKAILKLAASRADSTKYVPNDVSITEKSDVINSLLVAC